MNELKFKFITSIWIGFFMPLAFVLVSLAVVLVPLGFLCISFACCGGPRLSFPASSPVALRVVLLLEVVVVDKGDGVRKCARRSYYRWGGVRIQTSTLRYITRRATPIPIHPTSLRLSQPETMPCKRRDGGS
jgi:hypothetical protein